MKSKIKYFLLPLLFHAAFAQAGNNGITQPNSYFSDSTKIEIYTLKKGSLHLAPNPTTNGSIKIRSNYNAVVALYVFDVAGTMVHNILLRPEEEKKLQSLEKGIYTFDVFREDESIEQGKIIVK